MRKKTVALKSAQNEDLQFLGISSSGTFFGYAAPVETLPEMQENHLLENAIKIYLSKYAKRDDQIGKRELYSALILELEHATDPGEILRCRQLPSGDAMVIFTSNAAKKKVLDPGRISVQHGVQRRIVPLGPVGKNGELNFQRYLVQVTLPLEVGIEDVVDALASSCKVVEVVSENTLRDGDATYTVHFNTNSKYRIYAEFARIEEAIDLPEGLIIKGKRVT
mmetsp:Transcript_8203/g.8056  ORF Transcript_8203/g.8056 Transcript_8203/m.8056 type:complete len:222 (+) Transcript_8203:98-763(+)